MIDSHAHLTDTVFDNNRAEIIVNAGKAGISCIISAGTDLNDSKKVLDLALKHEMVLAAVGITPHQAAKAGQGYISELKSLASEPGVAAIGETGLDFYYDEPRDIQKKVFEAQADLAKKMNLPIIVHMRESFDECCAVIKNSGLQDGVCHCFTGTCAQAGDFLDLGFYISFSGIITYKNANLDNVVKYIPTDRLLVETDSPYLAPEPHRGRTNEPGMLINILEKIAHIRSPLTSDDFKRITSFNARKLFRMEKLSHEGTIAYKIRNSLYLNITNRCSNRCAFCPLSSGTLSVKGYDLNLEKEPDAREIIDKIKTFDLNSLDEAVFCGFGEPTFRLHIIKEVATFLKRNNIYIRLNTNGQGNLINNRDIIPELRGLIQTVSVSLNYADAESYAENCVSAFGKSAYGAVKDFIKSAGRAFPRVIATAVDMPDLDKHKLYKTAAELGVPLRMRPYQEIG
ncbi:MAG: YchF/TatD family DNA exonuclease [bacterium]